MTKNTLFATAKSKSVIEVYANKEFCPFKMTKFRFYVDHKPAMKLEPVTTSESHSANIYTIVSDDFNFVPGHYYEIATEQNYFVNIDISYMALTPEFEQKYRYDGKLGAIYTKERTIFRVYSPFSVEISLHVLKYGATKWETYSMTHDFETGVFEAVVEGDYDGASYLYERLMFGESTLVADPYCLSMASNSRWSFVINPERVKQIDTHSDSLPVFDDPLKAIIYECDVRDMTSLTSIEHKGTFKALATKGYKDEKGLPIGLDYLASLGVSHVQLMPVLDFQTIDEDDPFSMYNWGYDPVSYFSPEGSYSSDPYDPYARVLELRELVGALHQEGIRVTLDVVYNHVYSTIYNPLNVLVPKYYYRADDQGRLSNGSGCGNDLESRHYMVRKLIIDSLTHLMDFYDVDGYRFDLMGILDIETIRLGYEALKQIKPNLLYYGEGWDLWTALPGEQKASYYNAHSMPYVSFFNDRFRDIVKGKSNESEIGVKGYLLGDTNYRDGFKHVLLGSAVALAFAPMFDHVVQSVNYVECHDNHTLFDKIKIACPDDSDEEVKKRIKLCTAAILLAGGIPLFHQGQEIGGSKNKVGNSYNSGDEINGFHYDLLDRNEDMYHFFIDAIKMKKAFINVAGEDYDYLLERNKITFENLDHGALKIKYDLQDCNVYIIFNPSKDNFMYEFENYVNLVFNDSGIINDGGFFMKMAIVNALSFNIFYEKKTVKVSPDYKEVN